MQFQISSLQALSALLNPVILQVGVGAGVIGNNFPVRGNQNNIRDIVVTFLRFDCFVLPFFIVDCIR